MPVSHDTAVELVRDLLELQRVMKRVTKTDAGERQLNPTAIALLYYLTGTGPDDTRLAGLALTRVAPEGSLVVNSSRGGGAKDTWIVSPDAAASDRNGR